MAKNNTVVWLVLQLFVKRLTTLAVNDLCHLYIIRL